MALVERFNNNPIKTKELLKALNELNHKMCQSTMYEYLNRLKEEKKAGGGTPNLQAPHATAHLSNQSQSTELWDFSNPAPPLIQAPQIAQQPSNFTSGNPGSSTSASNKGKSTNFSKAPGASSHYGGALPSQQAPPMDETFVPLPSQAETDSTNWFEENSQNNDGDLQSMVNPPSSWKRALGFLSSLVGASPQEPQFSPSMHDTSAASSYYPSNQPDDETLQSLITPRNPSSSKKDAPPFLQAPQIAQQSSNFTSGNPGSLTSASNKGKSTNFSKAPGLSSHYGGTMPSQQAPPMYGTDVPSQAGIDSTNWFEENLQNDEGSLQSLVNPKNTSSWKSAWGSASNYCGAIPFQQAPMSGTLFPAFSNQPSNQSAPLNPSTNSVSSQPGTPSLDWSEGNSQNDDGSLYSVVRPKRPSSSKGKSATKTGKKPRK